MTPEIRKLAEDLLALAGKATIEWLPGYEIAPDGSVWSNIAWRGASHRRLTPYPNSHGYLRVRVMLPDGVRKSCFVHKLVAEAFLPPRPSPSHEIRHLNGDRVSNSASNLAWGTRKENAADRKAHGRDMGAENGRSSAHKLRGRKRTHCKRGHDKEGRGSCEQCRRDSRNRLTVEGLSIANYIAACSPDAITKLAREVLGQETWRITASELVTIMDTHLYVAQRGPDDEHLDEPCVAGFGEATLAILNRLTQPSAPVKEC